MSEVINVFSIDDPETAIPMDRDEFYKEQTATFKKTGKPTKACEIIDVFIFNRNQELLIQKRSFDKSHNPGMLDKSIGGHVRYGDTADYSVMVETVQELQTPSIVLKNTNDFQKTLKLLNDYLTTIAVIKHSHSKIYKLDKVMDGETIKIANKIHAYFGIYDGPIRPVDREAKGVLWYSVPELEREMKKFPDTFTNDMHVLVKELRPDLEDFLKLLQKLKK